MSDEVYDQERDPAMEADVGKGSTADKGIDDDYIWAACLSVLGTIGLLVLFGLLSNLVVQEPDTSLSENTAQKQECLEQATQETVRIEHADGISTTIISPDTKHCYWQ